MLAMSTVTWKLLPSGDFDTSDTCCHLAFQDKHKALTFFTLLFCQQQSDYLKGHSQPIDKKSSK